LGPQLILEVVAGQIWNIMPSIIWSWLIDLIQSIFRWVDFVGSLPRRVAGNVSKEDLCVSQKFSELPIGDDESAESSETL
jgi:hypothetical protein